ncbi:unnamed protein product (mitochondrion) [Plasmodiophora brassicae]|uniref:Phosphodiesterase n=1 Tax=Plasmodiophora brassicae TaxID=37360 RepID=A0A0G4IH20_PLABS|nr:hypothetical protein PBRA_000259 [Plasmodiophora brassicae]SPQ96821.1 unnamed protein product [Plasmodiophora brassicae]
MLNRLLGRDSASPAETEAGPDAPAPCTSDDRLRYLTIVVDALASFAMASDCNDVYLTLQKQIGALLNPHHIRITASSDELDESVADDEGLGPTMREISPGRIVIRVDVRTGRRSQRGIFVEVDLDDQKMNACQQEALTRMVQHGALACRNLRRVDQLAEEVRRTTGLLELRRQWHHARPRHTKPDQAIDIFLQVTQGLVRAERMLAFLVDVCDNVLIPVALDAGPSTDAEKGTFRADNGFLGTVLGDKKCIVVNNVQEHRLYRPGIDPFTDGTMKHVMCQPVFDRTYQVVALIAAINRIDDDVAKDAIVEPRVGFRDADCELLELCCTEMGDFLVSHFADSMARRATLHDMSAFSLMDSFLGRSISESNGGNNLSNTAANEDQVARTGGHETVPLPVVQRKSITSNSNSRNGSMTFQKRISLTQMTPEQLIETIDYNVFLATEEEMLNLSMTMYTNSGALGRVPAASALAITKAIRQSYRDSNPFHNFRHAFNVMHMAYLFITHHEDVRASLGPDRIFAVMIAALGHDIDHPGHSNQFEINTDSERALRYNGKAVLENYHAACLIKILREADPDPFGHLDPGTKRTIRDSIIDAILGTDMSRHMSYVRKLASFEDREALLIPQQFADQNLLMETIVHASDLSAQGYNTQIAVQWEERLTVEFKQQAKKEAEMGLPVASIMANLEDDAHRAQMQISFIDFVLRPYWKEVARLFPGVAMVYYNIILRSRQYYTTLKNDGRAAAQEYLQKHTPPGHSSYSGRCQTLPSMPMTGGRGASASAALGGGDKANSDPTSHIQALELLRSNLNPRGSWRSNVK